MAKHLMDCKVDYLAWTIPTRVPFDVEGEGSVQSALMIMTDFLGDWFAPIASGHIWEVYKSKGFYHTRIFDTNTKISIFVGLTNRHVYVEAGGQALDYIRALGRFEDLIQKIGSRASRIDFAVDFETQNSVEQFIVNRQKGRFKAGGNVFSEDGETSYIGSWKAERFARVYRYHEPHPRAKKLRAEVVLRGAYAKQGVAIFLAEGEVAATLAAHEPFGWESPLWQPTEATESRIKSKRADKERAGTVRWLYGDVISAIVKCHQESLIDVNDFIEKLIARSLSK